MNSRRKTARKPLHQKSCKHCQNPFIPDYRNAYHQKYCTKVNCRKASKRASQKKWLAKNPDVFSGHENVVRVQIWREAQLSGKGRQIYKLALEFFVFRCKGRKDRVEIVKKNGEGAVLQDFCELKNALNLYVIMRVSSMLQDVIDIISSKSYSFPSKVQKSGPEGRSKCQKKRGTG